MGLCVASMAYSFLVFLQLSGFSSETTYLLLQYLWMSGSLITYFYISSVKSYLKDSSNGLSVMKIMSLISFSGALFALMAYYIVGAKLFVNNDLPVISYNNIYMKEIGGFNPGTYVKILSLFVIIPTMSSLIYFFNYIRKSGQNQNVLVCGMVISLLAIFCDVSISIFDFTYLVPFMFVAHIFEISRITFSTQMETAKELHMIREDLIKVNKLSEAGSSYFYLAHEIMNPLMAAKGYFQLLLKRSEINSEDPKISKYIDVISQQHTKIEHLATGVKKFAKPADAILHTADPHLIIKEAIDTIQLRIDKYNIVVTYNGQADLTKIYCLRDQLSQVVVNLLNNAIDAICELPEKWIHIDYLITSNEVIISVKDSGAGIPEQIRNQIWEYRFTTKKDTGTGIGLTICSAIIQNHGGQLYLNPDSANTQFLIKLPISV